MTSKKIRFDGDGGVVLAGRLETPVGAPRAYALFAHCFTCTKDAVAAARIARALTAHGIAVLRFDFTGLGGSGGDFGNTGFSSNVADLVHAARHLREHYAAPTLLIGHSLGGAAVLAARHLIPEVRAVATIGAPADPAHVVRLIGDRKAEIETTGQAAVTVGGRTFHIRRQFLDDIAGDSLAEHIAGLQAALLVLHSPVDEVVGVDNARQIFDRARHPKSFVALDGARHLLDDPADAEFAATILGGWAARYAFALPPDQPPAGSVVVSENGDGPFGQTVLAGRHVLTADEPVPAGGDSGPSPYDFVLAGLGACTSMTVRMYAERKGWPLDNVTAELRHSRIHAQDCAECETKSGRLDRIDLTVRLTGDLDETQRRRLLEIADRCPVHRTLQSEVQISTTEAPADPAVRPAPANTPT